MVAIDFSAVRPNEISIEPYQQWGASTFRATYAGAERCLRDIVRMGGGVTGRPEKPCAGTLSQLKLPDCQNRVMAFVGDRGEGKTSAMVSFVNACVEGALDVRNESGRCSFYTLPVIEPSSFSEGENIVGCVVSQIYSRLEDLQESLDRSLIEETVNQCTDIREAIRVQGMSTQALLEQNSDELSHLRLLAQTKRLRDQLGGLITSYLRMCESQDAARKTPGSCFLMIPIDDIDTSIHAAYRLAEELRNYFMLPHVIVVLALKPEQLSDALEQRFIHEFKDLYEKGVFLDTPPAAMAAKYIQKLIPEQRQIQMPGLSVTTLASCTLRTGEGEPAPLVPCLLELIYRKTGILLVPDEQKSHPLIPCNLRALHQMLRVFLDMEDRTALRGPQGQRDYLLQLERTEKWLLNRVSASQLSMRLSGILREFISHTDQGLNAFLWRALVRFLSGQGVEPEVRSLAERRVRNENISAGDVLHLLSVLEETDVSWDFALFGAAVRMLYSIRIRRVMVQSLSLESEDQPVEEALPDMPEEGFQGVFTVLNGLIYDPVQRLTYDGFERMYNGDAMYGKVAVPTGGELPRVYSLCAGRNRSPVRSGSEVMSPREAVWSSLFVLGFGRVRNRDIHTLDAPILTGILPPSRQRSVGEDGVQTGEPAFLSANWMAFAHNLLRPKYAANRLLWQVWTYADWEADAFQAEVDKLKAIRYPVLFGCLRLDSADFLHRLIRHMAGNKEAVCQNAEDDLATFNSYFDFRIGLFQGIEAVGGQSCAPADEEDLEKLRELLRIPCEFDGEGEKLYRKYDWMGTR